MAVDHFVKQLRRNMTEAERRVCYRLRRNQLDNHHFRRQVPMSRYVLDFVCHEKKLVIELDGGQHASNKKYDDRRTQWLESQRYRVLRYWNSDVMRDMDWVIGDIHDNLNLIPPPLVGGGEGEGAG